MGNIRNDVSKQVHLTYLISTIVDMSASIMTVLIVYLTYLISTIVDYGFEVYEFVSI